MHIPPRRITYVLALEIGLGAKRSGKFQLLSKHVSMFHILTCTKDAYSFRILEETLVIAEQLAPWLICIAYSVKNHYVFSANIHFMWSRIGQSVLCFLSDSHPQIPILTLAQSYPYIPTTPMNQHTHPFEVAVKTCLLSSCTSPRFSYSLYSFSGFPAWGAGSAMATSLSSFTPRLPRNRPIAVIPHEAVQSPHAKPAMAASARAAMQTDPRQNRSLLRKVAREMNPTKWKSMLKSSAPRLARGWETSRPVSILTGWEGGNIYIYIS